MTAYMIFIMVAPWDFGMRKCMKRLSSVEPWRGKHEFKCVHGLKVISMSVLIAASSFGALLVHRPNNFIEANKYMIKDQPWLILLANPTYMIDTFFVIGGFLTGYHFTRKAQESNRGFFARLYNSFAMRFLRYAPTINTWIFVGLWCFARNDESETKGEPIYTTGLLGSISGIFRRCEGTYWKMSFFLSWTDQNNECLPHLWYISSDFYYYLASSVICIFLLKNQKLTRIIVGFLMLGSITITACLSPALHLYFPFLKAPLGQSNINCPGDYCDVKQNQTEWWQDIERKPWTRLVPYFIGVLDGSAMITGSWLLTKERTFVKKFDGKLRKILTTFVMLSVMFAIWCFPLLAIYSTSSWHVPVWISTLNDTLSRPLWGFCIIWIILLCETGNGWYIGSFLRSKWWLIPSRVTFGVFLTHTVVILRILNAAFPKAYTFTWGLGVLVSLYSIVACFITGILFEIFIENPVRELILLCRRWLHKLPCCKSTN